MGKLIDLTGQRFGRLTVIERAGVVKYKSGSKVLWRCVCDCGVTLIVLGNHLKSGNTRSCGCLPNRSNTKHGKRHTRLYRIFSGMKTRCYNHNDKRYMDYGGRGIKICDEWFADFMNFYNWAMANGYDDTKSIDRIDNDGSYEPSNCRWVTIKEQQSNKRNNRNISYGGKTQTIKKWSKELDIPISTLHNRLRLGWTIEEALTTPKGEKRRST